MDIAIVGIDYSGLFSDTCFVEMGAHVTCVDVQKTQKFKDGIMPIYELSMTLQYSLTFHRLKTGWTL